MKKAVTILLIAALAVSGTIYATTAFAKTNEQTETSTDNSTNTVCTTEAKDYKSITDSKNDFVIPDVTGTWVHENNPNGRSIQVVKQNGNDLELLITAVRGNASQIATAKVSVSLDTYFDGVVVRGTDDFEYQDSFGNKGKGSVTVSENVITLVIDTEESSCSGWGIMNSTGDYIFASNDINENEYNK